MQCYRRLASIFLSYPRKQYATTSSITLRPYQEHCLDACTSALALGSTRIGVSLPTGSGKTTVFISLLSRIPPPAANEKATKSLIIVNTIELARQSAEQVKRLFPSWHVEIEQGTKYQASGHADVTVATYQTLSNERRVLKFDPKTLKAIIVDEAHHAAAPSYRRLLARFDSDIKHPEVEVSPDTLTHKIPIIGFSATFGRHDGIALGSVFDRIVYHRSFLEMIKEEWLCDVLFTSVKANLNLKDVTINSRTGDFNPTSLAHVVNSDTVNELVVRTWLDRASSRKSTLIFCVDIAHVEALTQAFRRMGIDARYLSSKTPATERKALVQSFKDGEYPVLVNCAILTEGADIPNIDCVIVARPTRSRNVFAQMIGRGMRLSPSTGKTDCRIIDFVDAHNRLNGVITSPTLFGLNPEDLDKDIDDETMQSLEARAEQKKAQLEMQMAMADGTELPISSNGLENVPLPTSVTFIDIDDPFRLESMEHKSSRIRDLSSFTWVDCGHDIYVLELLKKGFIRVERGENGIFLARYTPALYAPTNTITLLKLSPYQTSRVILESENLEDAIRGSDTYVVNSIFRNSSLSGLYHSAAWRSKPASEAQINYVRKRWAKNNKEREIVNLTKGDAAAIITRLRNGSYSRFQKKTKILLKAKKDAEKEQLRRAREIVQVGPLPV